MRFIATLLSPKPSPVFASSNVHAALCESQRRESQRRDNFSVPNIARNCGAGWAYLISARVQLRAGAGVAASEIKQ
jgi:hypothetical protein